MPKLPIMSESVDGSRSSPSTTAADRILIVGSIGTVAVLYRHLLSRLVPINLVNQSVFKDEGEYTYSICEE